MMQKSTIQQLTRAALRKVALEGGRAGITVKKLLGLLDLNDSSGSLKDEPICEIILNALNHFHSEKIISIVAPGAGHPGKENPLSLHSKETSAMLLVASEEIRWRALGIQGKQYEPVTEDSYKLLELVARTEAKGFYREDMDHYGLDPRKSANDLDKLIYSGHVVKRKVVRKQAGRSLTSNVYVLSKYSDCIELDEWSKELVDNGEGWLQEAAAMVAAEVRRRGGRPLVFYDACRYAGVVGTEARCTLSRVLQGDNNLPIELYLAPCRRLATGARARTMWCVRLREGLLPGAAAAEGTTGGGGGGGSLGPPVGLARELSLPHQVLLLIKNSPDGVTIPDVSEYLEMRSKDITAICQGFIQDGYLYSQKHIKGRNHIFKLHYKFGEQQSNLEHTEEVMDTQSHQDIAGVTKKESDSYLSGKSLNKTSKKRKSRCKITIGECSDGKSVTKARRQEACLGLLRASPGCCLPFPRLLVQMRQLEAAGKEEVPGASSQPVPNKGLCRKTLRRLLDQLKVQGRVAEVCAAPPPPEWGGSGGGGGGSPVAAGAAEGGARGGRRRREWEAKVETGLRRALGTPTCVAAGGPAPPLLFYVLRRDEHGNGEAAHQSSSDDTIAKTAMAGIQAYVSDLREKIAEEIKQKTEDVDRQQQEEWKMQQKRRRTSVLRKRKRMAQKSDDYFSSGDEEQLSDQTAPETEGALSEDIAGDKDDGIASNKESNIEIQNSQADEELVTWEGVRWRFGVLSQECVATQLFHLRLWEHLAMARQLDEGKVGGGEGEGEGPRTLPFDVREFLLSLDVSTYLKLFGKLKRAETSLGPDGLAATRAAAKANAPVGELPKRCQRVLFSQMNFQKRLQKMIHIMKILQLISAVKEVAMQETVYISTRSSTLSNGWISSEADFGQYLLNMVVRIDTIKGKGLATNKAVPVFQWSLRSGGMVESYWNTLKLLAQNHFEGADREASPLLLPPALLEQAPELADRKHWGYKRDKESGIARTVKKRARSSVFTNSKSSDLRATRVQPLKLLLDEKNFEWTKSVVERLKLEYYRQLTISKEKVEQSLMITTGKHTLPAIPYSSLGLVIGCSGGRVKSKCKTLFERGLLVRWHITAVVPEDYAQKLRAPRPLAHAAAAAAGAPLPRAAPRGPLAPAQAFALLCRQAAEEEARGKAQDRKGSRRAVAVEAAVADNLNRGGELAETAPVSPTADAVAMARGAAALYRLKAFYLNEALALHNSGAEDPDGGSGEIQGKEAVALPPPLADIPGPFLERALELLWKKLGMVKLRAFYKDPGQAVAMEVLRVRALLPGKAREPAFDLSIPMQRLLFKDAESFPVGWPESLCEDAARFNEKIEQKEEIHTDDICINDGFTAQLFHLVCTQSSGVHLELKQEDGEAFQGPEARRPRQRGTLASPDAQAVAIAERDLYPPELGRPWLAPGAAPPAFFPRLPAAGAGASTTMEDTAFFLHPAEEEEVPLGVPASSFPAKAAALREAPGLRAFLVEQVDSAGVAGLALEDLARKFMCKSGNHSVPMVVPMCKQALGALVKQRKLYEVFGFTSLRYVSLKQDSQSLWLFTRPRSAQDTAPPAPQPVHPFTCFRTGRPLTGYTTNLARTLAGLVGECPMITLEALARAQPRATPAELQAAADLLEAAGALRVAYLPRHHPMAGEGEGEDGVCAGCCGAGGQGEGGAAAAAPPCYGVRLRGKRKAAEGALPRAEEGGEGAAAAAAAVACPHERHCPGGGGGGADGGRAGGGGLFATHYELTFDHLARLAALRGARAAELMGFYDEGAAYYV